MWKTLLTAALLLLPVCFMQGEDKCFRCHSMPTLGIKDESGNVINLSVTREEYYSSNHHKLLCTNCHSKEFETFPHNAELKNEFLYCTKCHKDEPKFVKYNFTGIEKEFKQSVHYKNLRDKYSCFSCHNPHTFKLNARLNKEIKNTIQYDNAVCLNCHNSTVKIEKLSGKVFQPLDEVHSFLPHRDLHWQSVRCIECHAAPSANGVSHLILPKEKAVKECGTCHSKNSKLVQSLYKFQSVKEREKNGFFNAVILNNSYVIGATRNYYLNLISFITAGIVFGALFIHGYKRWKK